MEEYKMKRVIFTLLAVIHAFTTTHGQEIHVAAGQGNLKKVKKLLEKDPSMLNVSYALGTPLLWAARYGQEDIVDFLINKGADVNLKSWDTSPLFHAAFQEHMDVVEMLLLNGAEIGFFEAIECGYIGIVIQKISKGEEINKFKNVGQHPLLRAARYGNKEIINYFIKNGIDINLKDRRGSNLLHNSALGGHYELVKNLVDLGVDINAKTTRGETPLDNALYNGHEDIITFLKENGAISSYSIETELTKISDSLYTVTFPKRPDSNVGLFVGSQGAMLIDTGGGLRIGKKLNDIVEKNHYTKVIYIINTHNDWDHRGGNIFFQGKATVINALNIEEMANNGTVNKVDGRIQSNFKEIFGEYYKMIFDGEEIVLIPAPGTHTPSDMLIYFSKADFLFTGDFITSGRFRRENESDEKYEKRIKRYIDILGAYPIEILQAIIDICSSATNCLGGHGTIFEMKDIIEFLDIVQDVSN